MKKHIISIIILMTIISLMIWLVIEKYQDTKIPVREQQITSIENNIEENTIIVSKQNTNKQKE